MEEVASKLSNERCEENPLPDEDGERGISGSGNSWSQDTKKVAELVYIS